MSIMGPQQVVIFLFQIIPYLVDSTESFSHDGYRVNSCHMENNRKIENRNYQPPLYNRVYRQWSKIYYETPGFENEIVPTRKKFVSTPKNPDGYFDPIGMLGNTNWYITPKSRKSMGKPDYRIPGPNNYKIKYSEQYSQRGETGVPGYIMNSNREYIRQEGNSLSKINSSVSKCRTGHKANAFPGTKSKSKDKDYFPIDHSGFRIIPGFTPKEKNNRPELSQKHKQGFSKRSGFSYMPGFSKMNRRLLKSQKHNNVPINKFHPKVMKPGFISQREKKEIFQTPGSAFGARHLFSSRNLDTPVSSFMTKFKPGNMPSPMHQLGKTGTYKHKSKLLKVLDSPDYNYRTVEEMYVNERNSTELVQNENDTNSPRDGSKTFNPFKLLGINTGHNASPKAFVVFAGNELDKKRPSRNFLNLMTAIGNYLENKNPDEVDSPKRQQENETCTTSTTTTTTTTTPTENTIVTTEPNVVATETIPTESSVENKTNDQTINSSSVIKQQNSRDIEQGGIVETSTSSDLIYNEPDKNKPNDQLMREKSAEDTTLQEKELEELANAAGRSIETTLKPKLSKKKTLAKRLKNKAQRRLNNKIRKSLEKNLLSKKKFGNNSRSFKKRKNKASTDLETTEEPQKARGFVAESTTGQPNEKKRIANMKICDDLKSRVSQHPIDKLITKRSGKNQGWAHEEDDTDFKKKTLACNLNSASPTSIAEPDLILKPVKTKKKKMRY